MFDTVEGVNASGVSSLSPPPLKGIQDFGSYVRGASFKAEPSMLAVPDSMAALFPGGGILKGSLLGIGPITDSCSVALALAGEVTKHRGWVAVSGLPSLGLAAAAEMGVDLERLVLVPAPGAKWLEVTATLADGFDMILARPGVRVAPADARHLAARVKQRGAVVVLVDPPGWPETPDLILKILESRWEGLEEGYGCLGGRKIDVELSGRRAKGRSRHRRLWLPAPPTRFGTEMPLDDAGVEMLGEEALSG